MNQYTESMRNALKSYKAAKDTATEKIGRIEKDFGTEAANRERERQEKQLKPLRDHAVGIINDAHRQGRAKAEEWSKLSGSQITDDIKLLEADLVKPADFEELKNKYRDNNTMLTALRRYGEEKNEAALKQARETGNNRVMMVEYNVFDMGDGRDRIESMDKAKKAALDILDMIDKTGNYGRDAWTKAIADASANEAVEHFGEGME